MPLSKECQQLQKEGNNEFFRKCVVFWAVDTQECFMTPGGSLFVKGFDNLKPTIQKITDYANERKIPIFGSIDLHRPMKKLEKMDIFHPIVCERIAESTREDLPSTLYQ